MSRYDDILDPDERRQKIEDDYKIAKIAQLRLDTFLKYLEMGFPVRDAAKLAGLNMSDEEISLIKKSRKSKN